MRKSKQETAETRKRIVEAASKEFRTNGIGGTGLDHLMAAAGLTHGGFYKHFESKSQVVEESLAVAVESWMEGLRRRFSATPGNRNLNILLSDYLSSNHRDNAANGCLFVALGSELARGGESVCKSATAAFAKMVDFIAAQIEGMSPSAAKKEAAWILSTMVGAMTMARATAAEPEISEAILRETRKRLAR